MLLVIEPTLVRDCQPPLTLVLEVTVVECFSSLGSTDFLISDDLKCFVKERITSIPQFLDFLL